MATVSVKVSLRCSLLPAVLLFFVYSGRASADGCGLIGPQDQRKAGLVDRLSPIKGTKYSCDYNRYKYTVSVCGGDILMGDNTSVSAIRVKPEGEKKSANQSTSSHTTIIGRYNATDIALDEKSDYLLVVYSNGDLVTEGYCNGSRWRTVIIFSCDPNLDGALTVLDGSLGGCLVTMSLRSLRLCPQTVPMGKATIVLVLFLTALVCYLVVGFAYRRIVIGAKGIEQIPNFRFWCILLGNIRDGWYWVLGRCGISRGGRQGGGGRKWWGDGSGSGGMSSGDAHQDDPLLSP